MAAGAASASPVKPAGGQWLWILLCRLRQSTVHGGGATSSPTTCTSSPSGSASALVLRVPLTSHRVHSLLRTRQRRSLPSETWRTHGSPFGTPLVHARALASDAAELPFGCHGLDRCTSHSSATWTCSAVFDIARHFERALRAFAYLPDRARSLRAMDRRLCLCSHALVRIGTVTVMTSMLAAMRCEAQDLIAILHASPRINLV